MISTSLDFAHYTNRHQSQVASNKDDMEQSLASAIFAIKDRLPGLNLYQHIYNDNHELDMRLQARIVSTYQGFIGFCIEASKYYKRGGPRKYRSHAPVSRS